MNQSDVFHFVDELDPVPDTARVAHALPAPWRVLVVDDDPDVHEATRFALRGVVADGRGLQLLHAESAAQGLALLATEPDIAVALVDVVMETEDAGLRLVERARQDLKLETLRIILRTGQPGMAPEMETIQRYDINDYKTKSELTRDRLFVSLLTALRSYDQLRRLELSRTGLEQVISSIRCIMAESGMAAFAEGIITQLAGLMDIDVQGLVCVRTGEGPASTPQELAYAVIAAAGPFRHLLNCRADQIQEAHVTECLSLCLLQRQNVLRAHDMALFFPGKHGHDTAAYVVLPRPLSATHRALLDIFCANITVCADNIGLLERVREASLVDEQLGVNNRLALCHRIDSLRETGTAQQQTLVLVDVDQFAEIREMLGYVAGDALLKDLCVRLAQVCGQAGMLARISDNTFALLGPEGSFTEAAIRDAVARPLGADGVGMPITVCLSWLPGHLMEDAPGSVWVKKAVIALKRAKGRGLGQRETYSDALSTAAEQRIRLLQAMYQAIEKQQFSLVYQPKLQLGTGRVVGLEALMRWQDDSGRMVPPDQFIPVAETSGLILPMGHWALSTALQALKTLHATGHSHLHMAVNVTVSQFTQPDFVAQVRAVLARTGMQPADLELEITESVTLVGREGVLAVLQELRALGVSLAIDDFGTGYSSLAYLDQVPAHRLKIDRAFVQRLDDPSSRSRIAGLIVPLGHQLGMAVVAEGVETVAQAGLLREMSCDEVQGYLFARPMPLPALQAWLAQPPAPALPWLVP